jgi:hypothetical protein
MLAVVVVAQVLLVEMALRMEMAARAGLVQLIALLEHQSLMLVEAEAALALILLETLEQVVLVEAVQAQKARISPAATALQDLVVVAAVLVHLVQQLLTSPHQAVTAALAL